MYAIAGVSGNTGSVVATTLLAQGKKVRVIVRDAAKGASWKAKGAEVAVAELGDRAALTAALAGVAGAYLLLPPVHQDPAPLQSGADLAKSLAFAVKAAKVPHVVLLSSVGAQHSTGTGPIRNLHVAEAELGRVTKLTAIRASNFQENWALSFGALAQGILPAFVPVNFPYPQVATADIGRTAAKALVEVNPGVIDLVGPRDYSVEDAAAIVSKIVGKPITATQAPLEAVVPTFTQFGLSPQIAELYREMYEGAMAGRLVPDGTGRVVRGTVELADTIGALLAKK